MFYFVVSLVGILHHEFFIDEAHHWLLARDSHSISELFANTRIEGHPLLWSFLLYGITRFTSDPFWMQFLHILISTSVVFLFLRKAPFSWFFKILFIFGYFILFEYNLISRNYMLGVLFVFLACSVFQDRQRNFTLLCVFLAFAANTHLMFSVIAFAVFMTLLLENVMARQLFKKDFVIGYLIFALGITSIVLQIQYTDSDWLLEPIRQMPLSERIVKGVASLFKGWINIPDFRTMYFWNSNYIVNAFRPLATVLVVLIYILPLLLFFKNRKTIFFVYAALIGTQVFFFMTQRAATRFQGITFIIFITALWMENYYRPEDYKLKDLLHSLKLTLFKKPIVYGILVIQLFSGIYAYTMDYLYPFTSAREAVDFFHEKGLDNREIVSVTCDGTLISAYLERKVWFLCDGGYESFCHWDSGCAGSVTAEKALVMLADYMQTHDDVIYVSYYPLSKTSEIGRWITLDDQFRFRLLQKFDVNMVDKTYYYVFEVSKK
jgi:hypothetical protein